MPTDEFEELEKRIDAIARIVGQMTVANRSGNLSGEEATMSPFATRVAQAVRSIPFGETRSYDEVAEAAGSPGGGVGVGSAMDTAIVCGHQIPWWRVTRTSGKLATPRSHMQRELLKMEGVEAQYG